jgi:hypothetical protein
MAQFGISFHPVLSLSITTASNCIVVIPYYKKTMIESSPVLSCLVENIPSFPNSLMMMMIPSMMQIY